MPGTRAPHPDRVRTPAVLATALFAVMASLPPRAAAAQDAVRAEPAAPPLARWLDVQTISLATRYNHIEDAADRTLQNRIQTQVQLRARLKLDEAGRYSVHAGAFTGNAFDSGWNPTGIGTGTGTAKMRLKHLFAAAMPWDGLALEYGSLPPSRGESTEITTYDNDAYLTAGRMRVTRPRDLFFDDVTVSVGYVGALDTPSVFDRTRTFSRQNYWQLLAAKEVVPGFTLSTDYSTIAGEGMWRQGASWRVGRPWLDTVAGEYGVRLRGGSHQTAFAFSGEKEIAGVTVKAGYANVDPAFGILNGDPYGPGNRVFTSGSIPLPLDLGASWFVQKEITAPATSANDLRVDVVLTWNLLKALKRARTVPGE